MENMPEEPNGKWHLDKRVSWGHIITTAVAVLSIMVWISSLDKKLEVNSTKIDANEHNIVRLEDRVTTQYAEIIRRLERLDARLSATNERRLEEQREK
jgi:hypothetical protein